MPNGRRGEAKIWRTQSKNRDEGELVVVVAGEDCAGRAALGIALTAWLGVGWLLA